MYSSQILIQKFSYYNFFPWLHFLFKTNKMDTYKQMGNVAPLSVVFLFSSNTMSIGVKNKQLEH